MPYSIHTYLLTFSFISRATPKHTYKITAKINDNNADETGQIFTTKANPVTASAIAKAERNRISKSILRVHNNEYEKYKIVVKTNKNRTKIRIELENNTKNATYNTSKLNR